MKGAYVVPGLGGGVLELPRSSPVAVGARSADGDAVGDAGRCGAGGAEIGVPPALGMAVPRSEPRGDEVPVSAVGWGERAPSVGPAAGAGGVVIEGGMAACGGRGAKVGPAGFAAGASVIGWPVVEEVGGFTIGGVVISGLVG